MISTLTNFELQTMKGRKYGFELLMQDQNGVVLAADSEVDATDWMAAINKALQETADANIYLKEKFGEKMT